jgi:hypothetical protein
LKILRDFVISANKYPYDLSDMLISQTALSATCETTLTFDKKASQFELFTLLWKILNQGGNQSVSLNYKRVYC